jgi:hypothetical protein
VTKYTNVLVLVIAAHVAACSSAALDTVAQVASTPAGPPADYRSLIRTGVPATLTAEAEVSELRKTVGPEPGEWIACLKSAKKAATGAKEKPTFVAVFFEGGKVTDYRQAVLIDRCESAAYSPLPPAPPPKSKQLKTNKKAPIR